MRPFTSIRYGARHNPQIEGANPLSTRLTYEFRDSSKDFHFDNIKLDERFPFASPVELSCGSERHEFCALFSSGDFQAH